MPAINRPQSNIQRNAALNIAKSRKDQVPAMPVIPYSAATAAWLDTFQPLYLARYDAVSEAKQTQTNLTAQLSHAKQLAIYNEQDFVLNLNRAIRREVLQPTDRTYYGIAIDNDKALKIVNETELKNTDQALTNGETNRLADGGAPITYPSIGEVNAAVSSFITLDNSQTPAKAAFNLRQEELAALNDEADRLILKLWNETETTFDTGDKASMRRDAREWGVVYKPTPGEAPSPDEFSIMGKVTEAGTGTELNEVEILVVETATLVLSDSDGDYFVGIQPPSSYTLQASKLGYVTQIIPGVVVTAGVITTVNIQLSAGVATGTVAGVVSQGGVPVAGVSVSVDGVALPAVVTDPAGNYSRSNVPAGMQTVRAQLPPAMGGAVQTQLVNVVAGSEISVNFNF